MTVGGVIGVRLLVRVSPGHGKVDSDPFLRGKFVGSHRWNDYQERSTSTAS